MLHFYVTYFLRTLFLVFAIAVWQSEAYSGELQASWTDSSNNEDGFKIERKAGTGGNYAEISTVGANIISYHDSGLAEGDVYCYRVRAFNSAGESPYSAEACAPARSTLQAFTVSVSKTGSGSGTVTSAPAGINCGSDCSESYNSGTVVTLTASPATDSTFAGWSGNSDCTDGSHAIVSLRCGTHKNNFLV